MSTNNSSPITRHPNGNIELSLSLAWPDIKSGYEKEVLIAVENTQLPGFRKGKAPKNMVEARLDKTKVYSAAIQKLLPSIYSAAITEHKLKPILSPNISLKKGDEGTDWEFTAVVCEMPEVVLPKDWEADLKKLKIVEKDDKLTKIIEQLNQKITITVPDLLVEEEAEHRLSHLVENLTQLGVNTETYLASKKMTAEDLRAQTATQARNDLATQFILSQIQTEKEFKTRQETLDFLISLL